MSSTIQRSFACSLDARTASFRGGRSCRRSTVPNLHLGASRTRCTRLNPTDGSASGVRRTSNPTPPGALISRHFGRSPWWVRHERSHGTPLGPRVRPRSRGRGDRGASRARLGFGNRVPQREAHGTQHQPDQDPTHPEAYVGAAASRCMEAFDCRGVPHLTALRAARLSMCQRMPTLGAHNPRTALQLFQPKPRHQQPSNDGQ